MMQICTGRKQLFSALFPCVCLILFSGLCPVVPQKGQPGLFLCVLEAQAAVPAASLALDQAKAQAASLFKAGNYQAAYDLYMLLLREDPTDDGINYGLARASEELGENGQTILALERLVDKYPRHGGLRMSLARALMRVGDTEAARQEFDFARQFDPALTDAMLDKAIRRLDAETSRLQVHGRLSAGLLYDSNVNQGPSSAWLSLGAFPPLRLESGATGQESMGGYVSASLDGAWRLGKDSAWWIVGDTGMFRKGYLASVISSRELGWGRLGMGLRHIGTSTFFDIRLKTEAADYISDNQSVMSNGPELSFAWSCMQNLQLLTRVSVERRDYRFTNDRQGWYLSAGQYARFFFGKPNHEVMIGGRYFSTDAARRDYSYDGWETSLRMVFKLPWSLELAPFAAYRKENYKGPATALESNKRVDENIRAGLGLTYMCTESLSLDLSWQYTDNTSESALYVYDQHLLSTGLTWRF